METQDTILHICHKILIKMTRHMSLIANNQKYAKMAFFLRRCNIRNANSLFIKKLMCKADIFLILAHPMLTLTMGFCCMAIYF